MKTATTPAKPAARSNTWGTSHFVSYSAALAYYRPYHGEPLAPGKRFRDDTNENRAAVDAKLAAGEIHIGPPTLRPGQSLSLHREERRYFITETSPATAAS